MYYDIDLSNEDARSAVIELSSFTEELQEDYFNEMYDLFNDKFSEICLKNSGIVKVTGDITGEITLATRLSYSFLPLEKSVRIDHTMDLIGEIMMLNDVVERIQVDFDISKKQDYLDDLSYLSSKGYSRVAHAYITGHNYIRATKHYEIGDYDEVNGNIIKSFEDTYKKHYFTPKLDYSFLDRDISFNIYVLKHLIDIFAVEQLEGVVAWNG